jgi:hypothetical protein
VLCKVSSIIMTVAIDAHYLPLVDFYALALLASRSTRWVRLRFVLHNTDHCFTFAVILALFLLAVPLASCSGRSVRLCFVLCNVGSIIMTVAINALYLPFVDFYAPALLASRSTRWVRLRFVLHNADHCLTCAVIIALSLLAVPLASWLEGRLRTALLLLAPRNAGAPIKGGVTGA